jgi:hypothetical protein
VGEVYWDKFLVGQMVLGYVFSAKDDTEMSFSQELRFFLVTYYYAILNIVLSSDDVH